MPGHETPSTRRRLSREDRHDQFLEVARQMLDERGTDEFTLGRLAVQAGVTKPVAYDHFEDRSAVFVELYRGFEHRQHCVLIDALRNADGGLDEVCEIVAGSYIDCWMAEGREMAGIVAALAGSPELAALRRETEADYIAVCRDALEPFVGPIDAATLQAVTGAGDALAHEVLEERLDSDLARRTLTAVTSTIARLHQEHTT